MTWPPQLGMLSLMNAAICADEARADASNTTHAASLRLHALNVLLHVLRIQRRRIGIVCQG